MNTSSNTEYTDTNNHATDNREKLLVNASTMGNQRAGAQVVESPFAVDLDIPAIDIPSYTFHRPKSYDRSSPLYFDAKNPSVCFGLEEAELYVKRLAIGLQNLGLQPDDKVLLLSPNSVFFPIVLWGVLAASCVFTGASPTASVFSSVLLQLKSPTIGIKC